MPKIYRNISVIGLGYVGLAIASTFGQYKKVVGFDKDKNRIRELKKHIDKNSEISEKTLKKSLISYTSHQKDLKKCDFYIIAVPTLLDHSGKPNFTMLFEASELVGKCLKKNDIVVYESTVYPGATSEQCIPILEKYSKLKCPMDFGVGYSPERINPSDKIHTLTNIKKIIAATDDKTLKIMQDVYNSIIKAGTHAVPSIQIAEAAKVIENTQRDLNISLMNEITLILHNLNIESQEVFKAASTKWNFMPFKPGLVGGHCIGVTSSFLAYIAKKNGYHPEVILAGRKINDYMPKYIAENTIKNLISIGRQIHGAKIAVFGVTYKENCADFKDSRVIELIKELQSFHTEIFAYDPFINPARVKKELGIDITPLEEIKNMDAIIVAVAHHAFYSLTLKKLKKMLNPRGLVIDLKGIFSPDFFNETQITLWRL